MSIINDALKKAGQPIMPENSSGSSSPSRPKSTTLSQVKPAVQVERRRSTPNWGPLFIIGVVLLITGPIVAPSFFNNPSSKIFSAPNGSADANGLGSSPKGQYAVEEMPIARQISPAALSSKTAVQIPSFRLSGVVYSKAESYCLINGKVVKTGEEIGGATVESISPTEVVLLHQGERITLYVEI